MKINNEEQETSKDVGTGAIPVVHPSEDQEEPTKPIEPVDPLKYLGTSKRPTWLRDTLQDAEGHVAPRGTFRESKRPHRYSIYMTLMSHVIGSKPSIYEDVASQQVWKDAMIEEYHSIVKNDVWTIVSRLEGKLVVTSRWIYKINHAANGSIEKYKARFVARRFS